MENCQPCWNLFLRRSQKSQWKENHTVTTLWKPIRSGLDRFSSGSLQRYKVFKLANEKILRNRDWFLSQNTSVRFPAKTLKSSMQQISLVWILQKVLQIWHGLTPFSTSEREAVIINARWNQVPLSSTTTTSWLKYFISSEKATKISPPSSAQDFTHSVFHGCKFWDWKTFLSSRVFEQSVGIYEPKAPGFRVFDPRGVTRINFRWQLVKFGQSQWK